jgi:hypothetical protein
MERILRSFDLVGQSFRVLMQDKELMLLPMMSGLLMTAAATAVFFGFALPQRLVADRSTLSFPVFLMYVVTYAIGIFFQAAVVAGATERMRGGDPTVGSALAAAGRRIGAILFWAVMAATIGMVLRAVSEKSGVLGRIGIALVGAAWSLATFFVVPVIVLEDLSVSEAFSASVETFKRTWGESLAGGVTLGFASFATWLGLAGVVALIFWAGLPWVAAGVGIGGALVIVALFSTLDGVYLASLYHYATSGEAPPGFDRDDLSEAFRSAHRSPYRSGY